MPIGRGYPNRPNRAVTAVWQSTPRIGRHGRVHCRERPRTRDAANHHAGPFHLSHSRTFPLLEMARLRSAAAGHHDLLHGSADAQSHQPAIMNELDLDKRPHFEQLESVFAFAFALGAIVFGWLADRWSVRWLYPLAVLAWSAAGLRQGWCAGFTGLLACRFFLRVRRGRELAVRPCGRRSIFCRRASRRGQQRPSEQGGDQRHHPRR